MVFAFTGLLSRVSAAAAAAMFFDVRGADRRDVLDDLPRLHARLDRGHVLRSRRARSRACRRTATSRSATSTGMGSFLFMGLIGLVLASIVNIFLGSPAIYWLTTFMGVIVFTGLAAYDTAKLKQLAASTRRLGRPRPQARPPGLAHAVPRLHQPLPHPAPPLRRPPPRLARAKGASPLSRARPRFVR